MPVEIFTSRQPQKQSAVVTILLRKLVITFYADSWTQVLG